MKFLKHSRLRFSKMPLSSRLVFVRGMPEVHESDGDRRYETKDEKSPAEKLREVGDRVKKGLTNLKEAMESDKAITSWIRNRLKGLPKNERDDLYVRLFNADRNKRPQIVNAFCRNKLGITIKGNIKAARRFQEAIGTVGDGSIWGGTMKQFKIFNETTDQDQKPNNSNETPKVA